MQFSHFCCLQELKRGVDTCMTATQKRTAAEQADHEFEMKDNRRARGEAKQWDSFCKKSDEAEHLIGELNRDGKTVYYINLRSGKPKEGGRIDLIEYLIRNQYV